MVDVIAKLKAWRTANKLSQRQAVEVMNARDVPVRLRTFQAWEVRARYPEVFTARALEAFLSQYPTITDPPIFGRWKDKVSEEQVTEILKLRQQGMTLTQIAQRYGITEGAV